MPLKPSRIDEQLASLIDADRTRSTGAPATPARADAPRAARTGDIHWTIENDLTDPALIRRWKTLAVQCDAPPFTAHDWVACWRAHIEPQARPRVVLGEDARGCAVALWPLCLLDTRGFGVRWNRLTPMGSTVVSGDRLDPLLSDPRLAHVLIDAVRAGGAEGADLIEWSELSADGTTASSLRTRDTARTDRAAQTSHLARPVRVCERRRLPLLHLPDSHAQFAARLSKKLRGHIRRMQRDADELGLRWTVNDQDAPLDDAIEQFMSIHTRRWQREGIDGNFAGRRFRDFMRDYAPRAHASGRLRLHRLLDGSHTVAALLAFHCGRRAYYYQSGWDPGLEHLSPGSLCIHRAIAAAIDEGLHAFDFLRGDESYKRRWADDVAETVSFVEPASARGRAVLAAHGAKNAVKRAVTRVAGDAAWTMLRDGLQHRNARTESQDNAVSK